MEENYLSKLVSRKSLFWQPDFLDVSAWIQHIPFAFWLIEILEPKVVIELGVHNGTSYFSFCQAIKALNIQSVIYGVDTWVGDEHAGYYEEQIFERVKNYNALHYSSFSTLIRSSFDDAEPYFTDGTIDLLHIDGLHTYEAVKHDFDKWLPKLSMNAFVVFHDINVRERQFGVFRLWEELKARYKCFQFDFGHGLGILTLGEVIKPEIKSLFDGEDNTYYMFLRNFFSDRGNAIKLKQEHSLYQNQQKNSEEALKTSYAQLGENYKTLESHYFQLIETRKTLGEENSRLIEKYKTLETQYLLFIETRSNLESENGQLRETIKTLELYHTHISENYKILAVDKEILKESYDNLEVKYSQLQETSSENGKLIENIQALEQKCENLTEINNSMQVQYEQQKEAYQKLDFNTGIAVGKYKESVTEISGQLSELNVTADILQKEKKRLDETIEHQKKSIEWYKSTYEDRNIFGLLKDKIKSLFLHNNQNGKG